VVKTNAVQHPRTISNFTLTASKIAEGDTIDDKNNLQIIRLIFLYSTDQKYYTQVLMKQNNLQ
jgi:hypothetical protein